MAEVSRFPQSSRRRRGQGSWLDPYLDGQVWKLTKGIDFEIRARSIQSYVIELGKRRGMRVHTERHGDIVYLQAEKVQ